MLKIKDDVDLKELERFGFRKHKKDDEKVCISKWSRKWIEADSMDGYPCGSSGWEFYPSIEVFEDRTISVFLEEALYACYTNDLDVLFDIIQAGLVEKVEEQDGSVGD